MDEVALPTLDDSSGGIEENPAKKRASNIWTMEKGFNNKSDAQTSIINEKVWRISKSNVTTSVGIQTFYDCEMKSKSSCPAKIYLLFSVTNNTYYLYRNGKDHVHETEQEAPTKLRHTARLDILDKVKEYLRLGCAPRTISAKIREDETIEKKPTHGQVSLLFCLFAKIHCNALNYFLTNTVLLLFDS